MIVERQTERAAEWQRRREAKAAFRAERLAARDAGLVQRHSRKLAHLRRTQAEAGWAHRAESTGTARM